MQQPNAAYVEAIKRVAARPEGMLIHEYLQAAMDDITTHLIANNDPQQVRSLQGEARALSVLLKVWKP